MQALSNPSALLVLKAVGWRLLHDLEVTCTAQSQTSFSSAKYSGKRHPEFALQWCRTQGVLSSSSEHRCVCRGGAFRPAAFSTLILCKILWWVGYSLLRRGRSEKSKQLSFKLNLHYIAGLNTQGVFKRDCSRAFVLDFLFGFAPSFLFPLEHFVLCVYGLFPPHIYIKNRFTGEWDIVVTHSL